MKVFHCDLFTYPLPPDHRFPAAKYGLLRQRVADELAPPCELLTPDAATDVELLRVHRPEYLEKVVSGTLTTAKCGGSACRGRRNWWSGRDARSVEPSKRAAAH